MSASVAVSSTRWMLLRCLERELTVYRRLWFGSAFTTFLLPLLFLGSMGLGLGDLVDAGDADRLGGLDYLSFVAPGMLAASALMTAAGESLWPTLGGVKWQGEFKAMTATPMRPADVFGGRVLFTTFRATLGATSFVIVATVLGAVSSPWAVLAPLVAGLLGLVTAVLLSTYAVGRESDASFSLIMRLVVIPLFLFSGTFFPVDQLDPGLQSLSWLSPLWHAVVVCRGLTSGRIEAGMVVHVGVLVGILLVAWPLGVRAFTKRLVP